MYKSVTGQTVRDHSHVQLRDDKLIANDLFNYLSDKRVLYERYDRNKWQDCVQSVSDIEIYLSRIIDELQPNSELEFSLKQMQAACSDFLSQTEGNRVFGMDMTFTIIDTMLEQFRNQFAVPSLYVDHKYDLRIGNRLSLALFGRKTTVK